jgi:hypothetical protein
VRYFIFAVLAQATLLSVLFVILDIRSRFVCDSIVWLKGYQNGELNYIESHDGYIHFIHGFAQDDKTHSLGLKGWRTDRAPEFQANDFNPPHWFPNGVSSITLGGTEYDYESRNFAYCFAAFVFFSPLALVVSARLVRRHRQKLARIKDCCPRCGYDLRATPHRCPECGAIPSTTGIGSN